jgi:hypothetical protein
MIDGLSPPRKGTSRAASYRTRRTYPPLRGSFIQLGKDALLFTRGSVPYYGTYPGLRVPPADPASPACVRQLATGSRDRGVGAHQDELEHHAIRPGLADPDPRRPSGRTRLQARQLRTGGAVRLSILCLRLNRCFTGAVPDFDPLDAAMHEFLSGTTRKKTAVVMTSALLRSPDVARETAYFAFVP